VLSKEEITRILKIADLREKALITTIASGGFRLNAALKLQLKHFKDNVLERALPCYGLEIPEEMSKEREPYVTFISAEAAEYIRTYLITRQAKEEEITPESHIFIAERGGQRLSAKRFENVWRDLCRKAGLDLRPVPIKGIHKVAGGKAVNENAVRYNTRIHALRKFFKTACSVSGVDRMASEAFLGHSLTKFGVESVYDFSVGNFEWLRNEYIKVLPNVTFLKELPTIPIRNHEAREKIASLEAENQTLKQKLQSLEEDIEDLKRMIGKMIKSEAANNLKRMNRR
jgi:hypothetical protein